ncbi:MAG: ankyrin repeat domain-containing protein [Armatimonadota bacterium]
MKLPFFGARRDQHERQLLYNDLDKAAREGDTQLVRSLLDRGASPNGLPHQREPLAPAIRSGTIELVQLLLERGADPNYSASPWFCPLNWAIGQGDVEVVRLLIDQGADVNLPRIDYKPLMLAAAHGYTDIVLYLLRCGADLHARDDGGMTALTYAAMSGSEEVVELLRERGVILTVLDAIALRDTSLYEQLRELHEAAERENTPRAPRWGGVLMDVAVDQDDVAQVKLLLDAGVSPMVNGNTPLTQAIIHNRGEIVRLLLERGADPNQRTSSRGRAMKFARQKRNRAIIRLLKQHGARW